MRVAKQVFLELYEDLKKYVLPFVWHFIKWAGFITGGLFALGFLSYGYEKLGVTGEVGALLAVFTVAVSVAGGAWVTKAYARAKEKVSAQNKELLNTISGTTKAKPDVDDFIRRVKKQPQGNTP